MEEKQPHTTAVSSDSDTSVVNSRWGIITPNTEILILMFFGVMFTIVEVLGYWPTTKLTELFPDDELQTDFKSFLYKMNEVMDVARMYSAHIYLAAYILLPYPLITESQRVLLMPWLLCGMLRSVLLTLLNSFLGVLLCSSYSKLHAPCLQYCAWNGAEFCVSFYLWTSVHTFYYYLVNKSEENGILKVLKTIHRRGMRSFSSSVSTPSPSVLSAERFGEDDDAAPGTEATLVERAAMAWIAREILESGGDYVTDSQFSHYLAIKATMELRQIAKELAEKRKLEIKKGKVLSAQERIADSLEFLTKAGVSPRPSPRLEAFDMRYKLSRRDPIRRIKPLISDGKPIVEESTILDDQWSTTLLPPEVPVEERAIQTDPLTPEMIQVFDILEKEREAQEAASKYVHQDTK